MSYPVNLLRDAAASRSVEYAAHTSNVRHDSVGKRLHYMDPSAW